MSSSICDVERRQYEELNDLYKSRGEEIGRLNKELTSLEKEKNLNLELYGKTHKKLLRSQTLMEDLQDLFECKKDDILTETLKLYNKVESLEDSLYDKAILKGENKELKEELEHHQGWFQEIEEMLGTHDGCVVPMIKNLLAENQELKKKIVS
jgi:hypothetical protein